MICNHCKGSGNEPEAGFADSPCADCNGKGQIESNFLISLDEARILNQWLRLHHGLFAQQPDYIHLLRLINGIGSFVDANDKI